MPGNEMYDPSGLDASDTLDGNPGDDPLDTGVSPPDRWSAGAEFGTTDAEAVAGESLDQLLAEEEPEPDLLAHDVGIDGGAASAEEAAVHVLADDEDG